MRSCHLISNTNYTANLCPWTCSQILIHRTQPKCSDTPLRTMNFPYDLHITGPLLGEFTSPPLHSHHKGPVMEIFDICFVENLNKLLSKQLNCGWFEMTGPSCDITDDHSAPNPANTCFPSVYYGDAQIFLKNNLNLKISWFHDDVIKWKHILRYWPFVQGIHRSLVNSPHKGQWRGALMFSLICTWKNGWVHNHEAGDLRCHRAHYDVTVMNSLVLFYKHAEFYHPCDMEACHKDRLISLLQVCGVSDS